MSNIIFTFGLYSIDAGYLSPLANNRSMTTSPLGIDFPKFWSDDQTKFCANPKQ
jgi:hypothetical protein